METWGHSMYFVLDIIVMDKSTKVIDLYSLRHVSLVCGVGKHTLRKIYLDLLT